MSTSGIGSSVDVREPAELTTIPTNHAQCPALANTFALAPTEIRMSRLQLEKDEVVFDVYIDNVRWATNSLELLEKNNTNGCRGGGIHSYK